MDAMRPTIIMPHYIATEELKQLSINAIRSMRETSDVFIVSVDDGSPMDTTFLEEISDKFIQMSENSGFAKACNTGFKWAIEQGSYYIGCANNDIEVFEGWIEALIEPFTKWDDVGITGLVASKDRKEAETFRGRVITTGGLLRHHMQAGGLWLSVRPVLEHIGLFDEQFFMGCEDVDLFMRMHDKYGLKIVMSDKSMFWHKEGATRWNDNVEPGYKAKNKVKDEENYDKYAKKWGYDIRERGIPFYEEILEE